MEIFILDNTTINLIDHLKSDHSYLYKENILITKLKRKMAQIESATNDHLMKKIADNTEPKASTSTSKPNVSKNKVDEDFSNDIFFNLFKRQKTIIESFKSFNSFQEGSVKCEK